MSLCDSQYLKEIQNLCLGTIRHSNSQSNKHHVGTLRLCIAASSLLLVILNTNTDDRELYLQSYIDCVVEFLSESLLKIIGSNTYDSLLGDVIECLEKLSSQLTLSVSDDQTLTQIEYMCVKVVFGEAKIKDFDQLRNVMVRILARVFKRYPSQRKFIVNEMLSNISRLALQKGLPRTIQLSHGANVSFFTVFLVEIIQSFDATDFKNEVAALLSLPKSSNPHGASNVKRGLILSEISTVLEEASSIATQIADFFLERMSATDTLYKIVFSGLMEDLTAMMSTPEWPGAETAISGILDTLVSAMSSQTIPAPEEPYALEIIAKFGLECLELKIKTKESLSFGNKPSKENLLKLDTSYQSILHHLKDQSSKSLQESAPFQFQLLKTIVFYKGVYDHSILDQTENKYFTVISKDLNEMTQESMNIMGLLDSKLATLANEVLPSLKVSDTIFNPSKTYRSLILTTTFDKLYNDFLAILTVCLESSKVKLAAKAIRMLSPLVTRDPKILLHQRINTSISKVLSSGSALSKDAVIDLLGQYMFSSKEHIAKYHVLIGNRSSDVGTSVRKRVLKIMRNVFEYSDQIEVMSFAASRILKRLEDEEPSINEAAQMALNSMFFESENHKQCSDVMIELANSGGSTCNLLSSFIRRELRVAKAKSSRFENLKKIFDAAFDRIVDSIDSSEMERTEKAFGFIAALAECDSRLVSQDQLVSLQPFLVEEIFDREVMCLSALKIVKLALPNMKALRPEYVAKTNSILLKRLTKFQTRELHEAVQIIEVFSRISSVDPLIKAAISSMRLLWPSLSSVNKASHAEIPKIRKVLHLLGCFGSYCNFETSKDVFLRSNIGLRQNESITSLISRFLLFFCQPNNEVLTRSTALKNLLCVATYHPRLFLSESILSILDSELKSSSKKTKLEIIRGLTLFLEKEEEKLMKRNEEMVKSSKDSEVANTGFFGQGSNNIADGVCSSVIQRYISTILGLCLQDVSDVGEASVSFLQVVTKLGFANPKLSISTIIALEASPKKSIKRIATELHSEIFDKHESLADRSYVEAIRMACEYSKKSEVNGHLSNYSFLRSVYRVVNNTYSAKKKFVNSIVKLFHVDTTTENLADAITCRDNAVFLALNLSVLNFTSMEEVYLMIFHLNRFITVEGIDLAEKITTTIGSIDGKGMSVSNLQLLFVFSQTALAFIYLKQTLAASYCVRPSMMDGFRPSKPEMELRQQPKLVAFVDYPIGDLAMQTKLSSPGSFGSLFTRMVQSTRVFTT
ncbi:hypothetical protein JCM33374_g3769 [Metschnikowia sp. JCM 33374]|nr:hypothetical protein JCM33374_g3769 [Metschnikowia sp. JCM 33374]